MLLKSEILKTCTLSPGLIFIIFFLSFGVTNAQRNIHPADDSLTKLLTTTLTSKYYYVNHFREGRAAFHGKNCLWGYLDENLQEIIPADFDEAEDFMDNGLAQVGLKRGNALINRSGKLISPIAKSVKTTDCGNKTIITTQSSESAALYDNTTQKLLTDFRYNHIQAVTCDLFIYRIGIRCGLMSGDGKQLTEALYYEIVHKQPSEDAHLNKQLPSYFAVKRRETYGIIDLFGKEIIAAQYSDIRILGDFPLFAAKDPKTGFWGLVNDRNDFVSPFRYSQASINLLAYNQDIICILEEDNFVAYNHDGQRLQVFEMGAEVFSLGDVLILNFNDYRYILGKQGNIISDAYFDIDPFEDSLLLVQVENRYGLCDRSGKIVLPLNYTNLIVEKDDYILGWNDAGVHLLKINGTVLLPDYYKDANWVNDTLLFLSKSDQQGIFDCKNQKWLWSGVGDRIKHINGFSYVAIKTHHAWELLNLFEPENKITCDSFFRVNASGERYTYEYDGLCLVQGDEYLMLEPNHSSHTRLKFPPATIFRSKKETYFLIEKDSAQYNLIRKSDGKEVFAKNYAHISYIGDDFFKLGDTYSAYKIADGNGKWIIVEECTYHEYFYDLFWLRYEDGSSQVFDKEGKKINFPKDYLLTYNNRMSGLIEVTHKGLMGCVNTKGEIVIPAEYESLYFGAGGIIEAKKGLFITFFDKNGQWMECYRRKTPR